MKLPYCMRYFDIYNCQLFNSPGFDPSIRQHSGIWGAADEAMLNIVQLSTLTFFAIPMNYCSPLLKNTGVIWTLKRLSMARLDRHESAVTVKKSYVGHPKTICLKNFYLGSSEYSLYVNISFYWLADFYLMKKSTKVQRKLISQNLLGGPHTVLWT